jgi:hypothetical protein
MPPEGESAEPAPWPATEPALTGERRDAHEVAIAPVPTAETEAGIPFTSEAERVFEEAVAAPAAHRGEPPPVVPSPLAGETEPPDAERPANPRRGWWQRLTQS